VLCDIIIILYTWGILPRDIINILFFAALVISMTSRACNKIAHLLKRAVHFPAAG